MKKFLFFITFISPFKNNIYSQNIDVAKISNTPVKSGLSYEALTQFFQSSLSAGKNGGFDFKATAFGIKKLFSKKDLQLSDYYLNKTNKAARNLEISFGAHKGNNGDLNILLAGFKYAIINHRSKSDHNFTDYPELNKDLKNVNNVISIATSLYQTEINSIKNNNNIKQTLQNQFDLSLKNYNSSQNVNTLPARVQVIMDSIIDKNFNGQSTTDFFARPQKTYDEIAKKIDTKDLLTFSFNPGYDSKNSHFDTTFFLLQYLKGFGDYKKPWNFDGQLKNQFSHDSTGARKNLSRSIGIGSIGLNKILINDEKLNPIIEFELAVEDDYIFNGSYKNEDQNKFFFNTILRVHVSNQISLPISLKYDLKQSNVFGFFRVDWNLENSTKK